MADITNPQAVQFNIDSVRLIARQMAHLYYKCKEATGVWNSGVNTLIPNTADPVIEPSRAFAGVMTGIDSNSVIIRMNEYIALVEQSGVLGTILKACDQRVVN